LEDVKTRPRLLGKLVPNRSRDTDPRSGLETWSVAFSPDGSYFAWSQGHGIVKLMPWPLKNTNQKKQHIKAGGREKSGSRDKTIDCGQTVWSLAFGVSSAVNGHRGMGSSRQERSSHFPDQTLLLATGLANGEIKLWDVPTARFLFHLKGHRAVVRSLAFSPSGSLILVSGSRDKTLHVWDLKQDGKLLRVLTGHSHWVYCCSLSPDANVLCSVGGGRTVLLWNMLSYELIRRLDGHEGDVVSCDFSPDGAMLVTASYDTQAIVWDPHSGEQLMKLSHSSPDVAQDLIAGGFDTGFMRAACFSAEGLYVTSVADDGLLRIWCLTLQRPVSIAPLVNGLCCTFHPRGAVLAAGTRDGHVHFWSVPRHLPTLQHRCRVALRSVMSTQQVTYLSIPNKMKQFLAYKIF
uniref:WD repeat and SOCS box containing 2 n=2 Tax=Callorhinchus milii TaxID=7868 RepID=A0A4W3HNR7_CALMI